MSDEEPQTMINTAAKAPAPGPVSVDLTPRAGADGSEPLDFVRDNRIQVKYGSLFVDAYLVVHPRELAPANEEKLRRKLYLTYSINNPSFFETPERAAVALNLGQLLPVSLSAKRSKLVDEVKKFNHQIETGIDPDLTKEATDKRQPFASIVRDTVKDPEVDPVGMDLLKNGLAVYLLLREKLTQNHYTDKLTDYTPRLATPDQILSDLSDKLGVAPRDVREAALKGGLEGVGQLLGLDARYVADVKAVTEYAAGNDFGHNLVEHWHIGRQLLGLDAPLKDKIATGIDARITAKIEDYRRQVKQFYDVPAPVRAEEVRISNALELVTPIQRKLMYALGYEICYSPETTADDIAFHKGIYGLHRKAASDLNDFRGTYRIYFSGKGDLEGSMRTLVHEIAHNLWPDHFKPAEVAEIDRLTASDAMRFNHLSRLVDERFGEFEKLFEAYRAGNAQEKAAVVASANTLFSPYGITVDGLFPHLRNPYELQYIVKHAMGTLDIEGERYARSGYDTPQERFREVLSRFAELKQVRYRDQPELLAYLAPGLTAVFDQHYLPHLERVYRDLLAQKPDGLPVPGGSSAQPRVAESPQDAPKIQEIPVQPAEAPVAPKVMEQPKPTPAVIDTPKVQEQPKPQQPMAVQHASVAVSPRALATGTGFVHTRATADALAALGHMGIAPSL